MKPDSLDNLLRDYSREVLPPAPRGISAAVHQEIAEQRSRSFWTRAMRFLDWREYFAEPRMAIAALVCALAVGILPALASAKSHAKQRLARQSIHFDVFSSQAAPQFAHLVSQAAPASRSMP